MACLHRIITVFNRNVSSIFQRQYSSCIALARVLLFVYVAFVAFIQFFIGRYILFLYEATMAASNVAVLWANKGLRIFIRSRFYIIINRSTTKIASQSASPISIYPPTIKSRSYLLSEKDFSCSSRHLQKRRGVCYTQVVTNDPYFIERWKDHFPARSLASLPSSLPARGVSAQLLCNRFLLFSSPVSQFSVRRISAARSAGCGSAVEYIHVKIKNVCQYTRSAKPKPLSINRTAIPLLAINRGRLGSTDSRSIKICLCRYIRNASSFRRSGTYFLVLIVLNLIC